MPRKRPKVSLEQPVEPRSGQMEKLFAAAEDVEQASGLQLLAIRVDAIIPDPDQPRRSMAEDNLLELSESIKQDGVIQPIEVTEVAPDQYKMVHGERRWRAAIMAGFETIPAVVRRRDYDTMTRFVRQLVENIQREDLNDVDRAAALLHLRDLMQTELDTGLAQGEEAEDDSPWSKTITWAKVGRRLGMTRQRIHQLIQLLDLPEEIKQDVRDGKLSERETRLYQGLQARQQSELHQARTKHELTAVELGRVARNLKQEPGKTVSQAIREIRFPVPEPPLPPETAQTEPALDLSFESAEARSETGGPLRTQPWTEGGVLPPRPARPTSIDRLDWVRGHLARVQRDGLSPAERREIIRLLELIRQDVASLLRALQPEEE